AIGIGFVGILLIVRPGTEGFGQPSVYALIAVALVTMRELATRGMTRTVPSLRIAFWSMSGVTLMGAVGSLTETRVVPTLAQIGLLAATASCLVVATLMIVMAVRRGELGFVTPFRYTGLVWALVLGVIVFGDWPTGLTLLGAGLVVATGLFTLYRERQVRAPVRAMGAGKG
ncbi:MAG: DMT family transporter, partial [Pararhodobacter sp.]|nr:DMT family transporter [Pararhodobacter sp.]